MIQEGKCVKCRLCTDDSEYADLFLHFKDHHRVESEDIEVTNCLLLLHFSKGINDVTSQRGIGNAK